MDLPFEQDANPFVERAFEHKTFFTRLHHFVPASDAFVLELTTIWQRLQVKHVQNTPLILVGKMWADGVENMIYMLSKCTNDGQMILNMAQVLVQNRVAVAEAKLPDEVKRQGVTTKSKSPSLPNGSRFGRWSGSYHFVRLRPSMGRC